MGCPGNDILAQFLGGLLEEPEATAVREHIARCADCSRVHAALRTTSLPVTGVPAVSGMSPTAPPDPVSPGTTDARAGARGRPALEPATAPSAAAGHPTAGLVIGGRYRLERCLGQGGMGTVWAAEHLVTHERFALKLMRQNSSERPALRRRMLREARAAAAVRHPNVVRVIDVFEAEGGVPVLVMDLLEGETLRQLLRRSGRLGLGDIARIMVPAMAAVKSAHAAGVIHRDLKPDNLFLVRRPDGGAEVRVLDFGLARLIAVDGNSSSQLTRTGEMLGTPSYMSPEQSFGETDLDQRCDVWALGVILYECITGRRPFDGGNYGQVMKRITTGQRPPIREEAPNCPADVVRLVDSMLTVALDARPADLSEGIAVLSRHADEPLEARVVRPLHRKRVALAAAVVLAAAAITGLAVRRLVPAPAAARSAGGATAALAASPATGSVPADAAAPNATYHAPSAAAASDPVGGAEARKTEPTAGPSIRRRPMGPRPLQAPTAATTAKVPGPHGAPDTQGRTGVGGVATDVPF